jgi:ribosomal protein S18 acetylase RimI-like enzyme
VTATFSDIADPGTARLRPVAEDDLDALEILDKEVFDDLAYSKPYLRTFYNLFRKTWWVFEYEGDLVGYALVGPDSNNGEAWLLGLAVSARHRGKGLGKQLMERAVAMMLEAKIADGYITVRPDNAAAFRLYQEFGFTQVGDEVENYYGNGERRKVLHRSFARPNP